LLFYCHDFANLGAKLRKLLQKAMPFGGGLHIFVKKTALIISYLRKNHLSLQKIQNV